MSTTQFVPVRFIATGATGVVPEDNLAYFLARGYELITEEEAANTPFPYVRSIADMSGRITAEQLAELLDLAEIAQDAVAALLVGASGVTLSYNDVANTLTITGGGSGGLDAEAVRDAIGVALLGTGLITVTVNDALDTITITTTATANDTDANLKARANHTGTQSLDTTTDSATRLAMTSAERTKVAGVAAGATVNDTDANLKNRANHSGTQTSATISDFTEAAQDAIAALLAGTSGVSLSYNDAANTLTITGGGDATALGEQIRDTIGVALIGAGLITVSVNDALDTITISTTATANSTDATLLSRANHTGTQAQSTVVNLVADLAAKLGLAGGTMDEGANIAFGTATGTKLGTSTAQKLGFFNATPIVQPSSATDLATVLSNLGLRTAGNAQAGKKGLQATTTTPFTVTGTTPEHTDMDATAGAKTINLPATSTPGFTYTFKKADGSANAVTINPPGGGNIEGLASVILTRQYEYVTVVSTATSGTFRIIGGSSMSKASDDGRALRTFRGAYLGGASAPTDILILGASFEEGYGTTHMTNAWPNVFRDVLRDYAQPKGVAGGGSVPASNPLFQAGVGNYFGFGAYGLYTGGAPGTYPDDPLISFAGTFSVTTAFGLGLRGLAATANASTFTLEWFGTGMDLLYPTDPTFGAFTWAVDGGGTTAVNEAVAASQGNRVQIRGLSRGRHTITVVVTSIGTGGACAWEGAAFYDGDESNGIRVWQAARSGYGAKDYVAGTGLTTWINSVQTWNLPDLVIINLGINDWTNGRTSAQIKTDVLAIIAAVKARCNTLSAGFVPSIVLMSSFSVVPAGSANVEPWSNVVAKYREIVAADDDVCLFDYQDWFGQPTETAVSTRGGILVADGLHPTNGGAAIIGGAAAEFVLGSAERMRDLVRYGAAPAQPTYNASIAAQGAGFAADTYVTGSNVAIPAGRLKPGTMYRCKMKVAKTAAGTATPIVTVRLGTAGAIADTSRAVLTFAAQTAVADDGFIEIFVTFRAVGATTGVIQASGVLDHALAATGLSTANTSIVQATSGTFDTTTPTFIGISLNGGASAAWTISQVQAELQNAA